MYYVQTRFCFKLGQTRSNPERLVSLKPSQRDSLIFFKNAQSPWPDGVLLLKKAKTLSFISYLFVSTSIRTSPIGSQNFSCFEFRVSSTFLLCRVWLLCSTLAFCAPLLSIPFCSALSFVWLVTASLVCFSFLFRLVPSQSCSSLFLVRFLWFQLPFSVA